VAGEGSLNLTRYVVITATNFLAVHFRDTAYNVGE